MEKKVKKPEMYDYKVEVEVPSAGEARKARAEAAKRGWGFTKPEAKKLLEEWRTATPRRRGYIHDMLEDANYHTFLRYLCNGEYGNAAAWIDAEMSD